MDPKTGAQGHEAGEYLRAQRRIALAFDALDRTGAAARQGDAADPHARVMRVVARHAAARHDFERHRKRLAEAGRSFDMPELFDLVGSELPGFCPWLEGSDQGKSVLPAWSARAALGRLVAHGQNPAERGERFLELARAAARLVAAGSLGRAACAVAEAERLMGEAAAPPEAVEAARASGFDGFDPELLRPHVAAPQDRPSLRRVLRFFRSLQPVALLQALAVEKKRERRHLLLALLEAHGQTTRHEALDLLRADPEAFMTEDEAFVRRNLIYLLRRVPRPSEDGIDEEVAILARHAAPQYPPVVVKEAIGALGQASSKRAEQALLNLRERMKSSPRGPGREAPRPEDLQLYLERIASALDRRETAPKPSGRAPTRPGGAETSRLAADGLPGLLYELAASSASGSLLVEDRGAGATAVLTFASGRLATARAGSLSGVDAVYALLELFRSGSAVWRPQAGAGRTPLFEAEALELGPVVVEGLRRRDEHELARAIVPDGSVFAPKTSVPKPHPDEKDGLVMRDVWACAFGGRPALECEKALAVEPLRVRRLYLRWLEEGALDEVFGPAKPPAAAPKS